MRASIKTFLFLLLVGLAVIGLSCKDKVYVYEGNIDFKYPWYFFFDWTARINNPGYTESERVKIAALGAGLWPMYRVLADKGSSEVRAITAINPDFIPICYYPVLAVDANDPGIYPEFEFSIDVYNLLKDHVAYHLDGSPVLSWPSPSDGDPSSYWLSTLPATGGRPYNWDLMKKLLKIFEHYMKEYPGVCKGVFLDYYTIGGPYLFTSELDAHGAVDMDQDGVAFDDDDDEKTSWIEWEREFSRQLSSRFGHAFIQFANGPAVHEGFLNADEELAMAANGAVFEQYPTTCWNFTGAETVEHLYQMYMSDWFRNIYGHKWLLLFKSVTFGDPSPLGWDSQMMRISSLVFLVPYAFSPTSESNIVFEDPVTINAGTPTGDLIVEEQVDLTTYSRQFTNGVAKIVVNNTTKIATPSWTPN